MVYNDEFLMCLYMKSEKVDQKFNSILKIRRFFFFCNLDRKIFIVYQITRVKNYHLKFKFSSRIYNSEIGHDLPFFKNLF